MRVVSVQIILNFDVFCIETILSKVTAPTSFLGQYVMIFLTFNVEILTHGNFKKINMTWVSDIFENQIKFHIYRKWSYRILPSYIRSTVTEFSLLLKSTSVKKAINQTPFFASTAILEKNFLIRSGCLFLNHLDFPPKLDLKIHSIQMSV